MENENNPSSQFYGLLQYIFEHYNKELFKGSIKDCMIVITRKSSTMGHYSFQRWYQETGGATDELAINPTKFHKYPLIEICQTIVHEMCHAWQFHYGKPSSCGYHNKEWAAKMEKLGLMPSSTGRPGGKKTGSKVSDYPIQGGLFLQSSEILMNSDVFADLFYEINPALIGMFTEDLPLYDQIKNLTLVENQLEGKPKQNKNKVKYSCSCSNVWGKPGLHIHCKKCNEDYKEL